MSDHFEERIIGIFDAPSTRALIGDLRSRGRSPVLLPLPEILPVTFGDDVRAAIGSIGSFGAVVVQDEFAAEALISQISIAGGDVLDLDSVLVGALGESVSDRLRFEQIHSDVVPSRTDPACVVDALSEYLGGLEGMAVAIAGAEMNLRGLTESLAAAGAVTTPLPLYVAVFPMLDGRTRALLGGGMVDEMVFTTAREVAVYDLLRLRLAEDGITFDCAHSAVGEAAFQALGERGLRPLYFRA